MKLPNAVGVIDSWRGEIIEFRGIMQLASLRSPLMRRAGPAGRKNQPSEVQIASHEDPAELASAAQKLSVLRPRATNLGRGNDVVAELAEKPLRGEVDVLVRGKSARSEWSRADLPSFGAFLAP